MFKIRGKAMVFFMIAVLCLAGALALGTAADDTGHIQFYYKGSLIVDNQWEWAEAEKTLYIRSLKANYNETGQPGYAANKAWQQYRDKIEHIVLSGNFYKVSGHAFEGCSVLKDVILAGNVGYLDNRCMADCPMLESVTKVDMDGIPGFANLKGIGNVGNDVFGGSEKIQYVMCGADVTFKASTSLRADMTVCAPAGGSAETYAKENGLTFSAVQEKLVVGIYDADGNERCRDYMTWGTPLLSYTIDGEGMLYYTDKERTKLYTEPFLTQSCTLYARPFAECIGVRASTEGHQGLQVTYELNTGLVSGGATVKEFGVAARLQEGIGTSLSLTDGGVQKIAVWRDGQYVAPMDCAPSTDGRHRFTVTAVGYAEDGTVLQTRAEQDIVFTTYMTIEDKTTGKSYTVYGAVQVENLVTAASQTAKQAGLSDAQTAFLRQAMAGEDVAPRHIYTKEELLAVLRAVGDDPDHFIPGQHLSLGPNAIINYMNNVHSVSGGHDPAFASFDLMQLSEIDDRMLSTIDECKRFIEKGGIVTFSYHMGIPTQQASENPSTKGYLYSDGAFEALVTPGTPTNTRLREMLDLAGAFLHEFDKDGYPVIWRPLHEINGDWFWWCAVQGYAGKNEHIIRAEQMVKLWQYVHTYMTDTWNLKNVVWAYSPSSYNTTDARKVDVMYCYPGDAYVDIVGIDLYTGGDWQTALMGDGESFAKLMNTGKAAALTEFGENGALVATGTTAQSDVFSAKDEADMILAMKKAGNRISYALNWSGNYDLTFLGEMQEMFEGGGMDLYQIRHLFNRFYLTRP